MIEHMFEGIAGSGAGSDEGAAPVPPAMQQVSATLADDGEPPAAPWQEATPGPEMIAALTSVSLQSCTDAQLLDVLAGWERVSAWVAAQQTRVLARTEAGCSRPRSATSARWPAT